MIAGYASIAMLLAMLVVAGGPAQAQTNGNATGLYSSALPKAGERIFIEPLVVKDADIDNQITLVPEFGGGYQDSHIFQDPFTIEKRLTGRFSLQIGTQYTALFASHLQTSNFQLFSLQGKYMLYLNAPHEIMVSLIVKALVPSQLGQIGQDNPLTVYSYFVFNKGLGDLPWRLIRPFAVQSDLAWIQPVGAGRQPLADYYGLSDFEQTFRFDVALEYSLLYLNDIVGVRVPSYLAQLTPAIEARELTNLAKNGYYGRTAGYISYELNYQTSWYQLSAAYQQSFGANAPFRGWNALLYYTYFYDDLLSRLGLDPTPW
jgi:hypothetical protein